MSWLKVANYKCYIAYTLYILSLKNNCKYIQLSDIDCRLPDYRVRSKLKKRNVIVQHCLKPASLHMYQLFPLFLLGFLIKVSAEERQQKSRFSKLEYFPILGVSGSESCSNQIARRDSLRFYPTWLHTPSLFVHPRFCLEAFLLIRSAQLIKRDAACCTLCNAPRCS